MRLRSKDGKTDIVFSRALRPSYGEGLSLLSITDEGKEGKRTDSASCRYLGEKLQERRKMDGVGLADSVETFGVDVRSERLRSNVEGYGEEKVVRCEVLHGLEELWCSD